MDYETFRFEVDEVRRREHILLARPGNRPDAAGGVESFRGQRDPEWSMKPSEDTPEWSA